jgi:hypothetical protein
MGLDGETDPKTLTTDVISAVRQKRNRSFIKVQRLLQELGLIAKTVPEIPRDLVDTVLV